ncbi:MAG: CAP domain-containing protein [bacterium]|nr:CAP domain-containing protein [bacterium]
MEYSYFHDKNKDEREALLEVYKLNFADSDQPTIIHTNSKLVDFFVPCDGNNHHPKILTTKRAIFYSSFFVVVKMVVVTAVLVLPLQAFLSPDILAEQKAEVARLVDELRVEQGKQPLSVNAYLENSAQGRTNDMLQNSYFSHYGPNGHDLAYFLEKSNYRYEMAGENLAMGFSSAKTVVQAWVKSPLHYKNMIDPDFIEAGIGIVQGEYDGSVTTFMTHHFGKPLIIAKQTPSSASIPLPEPEVIPSPGAEVLGESTASESAAEDVLEVPPATEIEPKVFEVPAGEIKPEVSVTEAKPEVSRSAAEPAKNIIQLPDSDVAYYKEDSNVYWRYNGEQTTLLVRAVISGQIDQVNAYVNGYSIVLEKSAEEADVYIGKLVVKEPIDNFFKVVVTPAITILDKQGNLTFSTINWYNIKFVESSPIERYFTAKNSLSGIIGWMFGFSNAIYLTALAVFIIALLMNIFIRLRHQHPHIIAQTFLIIALLSVLIVV